MSRSSVTVSGDRAGTEVAGNHVNGGISATNNLTLTEISGNWINAGLDCSGNNPAPVDEGRWNRSAGRTGQCVSPTF